MFAAAPFSLADRHASAQPRDLAFYRDPYAFYDAVHAASPAFFWDDYNHWCFAGFKDVSALLRDKRFGRQIFTDEPRAARHGAAQGSHRRF